MTLHRLLSLSLTPTLAQLKIPSHKLKKIRGSSHENLPVGMKITPTGIKIVSVSVQDIPAGYLLYIQTDEYKDRISGCTDQFPGKTCASAYNIVINPIFLKFTERSIATQAANMQDPLMTSSKAFLYCT